MMALVRIQITYLYPTYIRLRTANMGLLVLETSEGDLYYSSQTNDGSLIKN